LGTRVKQGAQRALVYTLKSIAGAAVATAIMIPAYPYIEQAIDRRLLNNSGAKNLHLVLAGILNALDQPDVTRRRTAMDKLRNAFENDAIFLDALVEYFSTRQATVVSTSISIVGGPAKMQQLADSISDMQQLTGVQDRRTKIGKLQKEFDDDDTFLNTLVFFSTQ
jgi:hypothetical protein